MSNRTNKFRDLEHTDTQQGQCWACPYYQAYGNYCDYYKMELNGNGYEPTCRNEELKTNNDKIQTKWKITLKE